MNQQADDRLARALVDAGFDPVATPYETGWADQHVVITRPRPGTFMRHRTLAPIEYSGTMYPAQVEKLKLHGNLLDTMSDQVDYEAVVRKVYDKIKAGLGIRTEPGFAFSPHDIRTNRPSLSVEIASNRWERADRPLTATFTIFDPTDPLNDLDRILREIRRTRAACAESAVRQRKREPIVERSAAIILAHALRDEAAVERALRAPAAWPRITHVFNDAITTKQENYATDVPGMTGITMRTSANHTWLTTHGRLPGHFMWTGTTFMTADGIGLSETVKTAIIGCGLAQVVDHPWLRGIDAPIVKATAKGKGDRARLSLKTASDRVPLRQAMDEVRRILDKFEDIPLPAVGHGKDEVVGRPD